MEAAIEAFVAGFPNFLIYTGAAGALLLFASILIYHSHSTARTCPVACWKCVRRTGAGGRDYWTGHSNGVRARVILVDI